MTNNFVSGNYEDKYNTNNKLYQLLMGKFLKDLEGSLDYINENNEKIEICEVGCGDGEILKVLKNKFLDSDLFACDLSAEEIEKAQEKCTDFEVEFSVQNAEDLNKYSNEQFDLVVCVEVLEHLSDPNYGLRELKRISAKYLLGSVPNEPIWRILNMLRGKYLKNYGNTPGHLNHWSLANFKKFLSLNTEYEIVRSKNPFPWQMTLLKRV